MYLVYVDGDNDLTYNIVVITIQLNASYPDSASLIIRSPYIGIKTKDNSCVFYWIIEPCRIKWQLTNTRFICYNVAT